MKCVKRVWGHASPQPTLVGTAQNVIDSSIRHQAYAWQEVCLLELTNVALSFSCRAPGIAALRSNLASGDQSLRVHGH
jgi:hypothetical protein